MAKDKQSFTIKNASFVHVGNVSFLETVEEDVANAIARKCADQSTEPGEIIPVDEDGNPS